MFFVTYSININFQNLLSFLLLLFFQKFIFIMYFLDLSIDFLSFVIIYPLTRKVLCKKSHYLKVHLISFVEFFFLFNHLSVNHFFLIIPLFFFVSFLYLSSDIILFLKIIWVFLLLFLFPLQPILAFFSGFQLQSLSPFSFIFVLSN